MGQCTGLIALSIVIPTPSLCRHELIGDHGLIGMDGDVLDGDLLLAAPAVPIQRLGEGGHGASGRLVTFGSLAGGACPS